MAIPSVSSLPENRGDVLRAAAWLAARLKAAGLEVGAWVLQTWVRFGLRAWCDFGVAMRAHPCGALVAGASWPAGHRPL